MQENIKSGLDSWADILIEMDMPQEDWGCYAAACPLDSEDAMNAVHIFMSVISNYVLHKEDIESLSDIGLEKVSKRQELFWNALHKLVLGYSWINTKTYYKKDE